MSAWDGCAPPPPTSSLKRERDLDPNRSTVPAAADYVIWGVDENGNMSKRPAEQSDLRHCASCTCPPEEPRYRSGQGGES